MKLHNNKLIIIYLVLFFILYLPCSASPGLKSITSDEAKEYGITGKLVTDKNNQVTVSLKILDTGKLRRGEIYLHVPIDSDVVKSTWVVVPESPLEVQFTLPKSLAEKATLLFSVSRKSELELELITMAYIIDMQSNIIFEVK